jgi:hypothetical protein
MRHMHIERKRTTAWPWVAGLAVLAVIAWGVTSLLAAPHDDEEPAGNTVAEEAVEPVPIPLPPNPLSTTPAVRAVQELAPLDLEDVGQEVRAEGEVVATGTDGYWLLDGSEVIRVDSDRLVRKGQIVTVEGVLQADEDSERTDRIAREVLSRNGLASEWRVARSVKLVARPEDGDGGAEQDAGAS